MHYVYILECKDKTLYVGYTNDLEKRLAEHNDSPRGARYTKSRRPVVMKYHESFPSLSEALSREYILKQLTRLQKLDLIKK